MPTFARLAGTVALDRALRGQVFSRHVHHSFGCLCVLSCRVWYACLLGQARQFPSLPLGHHLIVLCIHRCISFELCVQIDAQEEENLQPHPRVLAPCCGLVLEVPSTVASSCPRAVSHDHRHSSSEGRSRGLQQKKQGFPEGSGSWGAACGFGFPGLWWL